MKSIINNSIFFCLMILGIVGSAYGQNQQISTLQWTGTTSGSASDSVLVINPTTGTVSYRNAASFTPAPIDVTIDVSGLSSGLSSPNTFSGATFTPNTPASSSVIYINTADGTKWTYNGVQYVTFVASSSTSNFSLSGGSSDAGNNKTSTVYRTGSLGLGATITPHASAQLDVNSTTKGFLPPRMTLAQRTAIPSPSTALIVYCTDCSPAGLKQFNGSVWQDLNLPVTPALASTCTGFNANAYISGIALSGATYTVSVTNNSFSSATVSFQNSDLVLSGVLGITVASTSPSSLTLIAGQSGTVTYTLSGTPATLGTLTGTWSKFGSTCSSTKSVSGLSALFSASYCDSTRYNGTYVSGVAFSGNTVTVKLTNTSGSTTPTLPAPTTANLALSYTGTGTLTVASVSPNTSYTIANGATQTITYTLSGTPTSTGTLTGVWTYGNLSCTKTKIIGLGDATFTTAQNNKYVFSVNDLALPLNSQGTLAIGTTVSVPYTSGIGTYNSYTSPDIAIPSQFCEDGASNWTLGYSYAGGTFSTSGSITVTLITKKGGTITAWDAKRVPNITTINFNCASVPWSVNGNSYSNTVGIDEGGDAIRGSLSSSGSAYDAGTVNTLIPITQAEFNNMLNIVPGSSIRGLATVATTAFGGTGLHMGITNTSTYKALDNNSYVAGFALGNAYTYTGDIRIAVASSYSSATTCITNPTTLSVTASTITYYAVKRPTTHCGTLTGGLGYYTVGNQAYHSSVSGSNIAYGGTCGGSPSTGVGSWSNTAPAMSVVATTQKSW